ncbi:MAG: hypothetical protein V4858_14135 [Pseudomonadota bacterium]
MMKFIRPIAIAVAFFFGYVVPTIALFVLGGIGAARSDSGSYSATWLSMLLIGSYVICPLAGGYVAARLSKNLPYLHALIVSVLAGVTMGAMYENFSAMSTLIWIVAFSVGGIAGAWIHEQLLARKQKKCALT